MVGLRCCHNAFLKVDWLIDWIIDKLINFVYSIESRAEDLWEGRRETESKGGDQTQGNQ